MKSSLSQSKLFQSRNSQLSHWQDRRITEAFSSDSDTERFMYVIQVRHLVWLLKGSVSDCRVLVFYIKKKIYKNIKREYVNFKIQNQPQCANARCKWITSLIKFQGC